MRRLLIPSSSVRLGRVFGIPIGLHYSWFLVFAGVTWLLARNVFPDNYAGWSQTAYWGIAAATAVLFFLSVLAHELGHSVIAIRNGIQVRSITLFIFGGVAQIAREAPRPLIEFAVAIAGPLVSVALGGIFLGSYYALRGSSEHLGALLLYLGEINLSVAVFNMVPGFPLDGGRVFRSITWGITHNYARATRIAAGLGQIIGFGFIAGGIALGLTSRDTQNGVYNALWLSLIGWFLVNMAGMSGRQATLRDRLKGVQVRDLMTADPPMLPQGMDLRSLINNYLAFTDRRMFLVSDGAKWTGVLNVATIKQIPRERWANTTAGDVMTPCDRVRTVQSGEDIARAIEAMDAADVSQIPVVDDGRVVGMLARDSVTNLLRSRQELRRGT